MKYVLEISFRNEFFFVFVFSYFSFAKAMVTDITTIATTTITVQW